MLFTFYSAIIVVVDPVFLVLSRFCLGVPGIVHGDGFGLGRGEDGQDRDGNGLGRHGGSPVLAQHGQANVTVGVHVFVLGDGGQKVDRGGHHGVLLGELDPEFVLFSLVNGVLGPHHSDDPYPHVGPHPDRQVGRWGLDKLLELHLNTVIGIGRRQLGIQMLLSRRRLFRFCRLLFLLAGRFGLGSRLCRLFRNCVLLFLLFLDRFALDLYFI